MQRKAQAFHRAVSARLDRIDPEPGRRRLQYGTRDGGRQAMDSWRTRGETPQRAAQLFAEAFRNPPDR